MSSMAEQQGESETNSLVQQVAVDMPESDDQEQSKNTCIYRVPEEMRNTMPQAYTPTKVAIGPIHNPVNSNADNPLNKMEDDKKQFMEGFINRNKSVNLQEILHKIEEEDEQIRSYYSERPVPNDRNLFAKMILLDCLFIIEYFIQTFERQHAVKSATFSTASEEFYVWSDFLLQENQIPFDIIEKIYELGGRYNNMTFMELTCSYFKKYNLQNIPHTDVPRPHHFVDLLRYFLLPPSIRSGSEVPRTGLPLQRAPTASQLSEAGLVFQVSGKGSLLEIDFQGDALTMGKFLIEEATENYIRNLISFEQLHYSKSPYITEYLLMLSFLVKSEKDANILNEEGILVDWVGGAANIVKIIQGLNRFLMTPNSNLKYHSVCEDLKAFHSSRRRKFKALLAVVFSFALLSSIFAAFLGISRFVSWISGLK